ncbi:hypothetical protein GCM10009799_24200 [Nocardiopsis rhodophaea]|uniref:Uncharacterized protein n=1 Tax=Nocardiopsis rhodophaea TaxID=280238 RepID=A0ABP5EEB9_9ACTN
MTRSRHSRLRRLTTLLIPLVTSVALMASTSPASAEVRQQAHQEQAVAEAAQNYGADPEIVNQILDNINAARADLQPGHSRTVYEHDRARLIYTLPVQGSGQLEVVTGAASGGATVLASTPCHMAAEAAVSAIGAAAFAAAAAAGGIVVAGIWVSAEAAGAFSASLAAGSGGSALVAQYIC